MRFVVAIVLFVAALASVGYGVAQRTVLAGPSSYTAELEVGGSAPVIVVDGATLGALPGTQGVQVEGTGPVFMAYGRTADLLAWVGDADHREIGWDAETRTLTSTLVPGLESTVPSPAGSDLWVQEFSGVDELTRKVNVPASASLLIAADGTLPAPGTLSITWPLDNSAPWSGPLIIGGGALLLAGLAVFVWGLIKMRQTPGPRRKQPKLPNPTGTPPRELLPLPERQTELRAAPDSVAPSVPTVQRSITAAAALLVAAAVLSGCSSDAIPVTPIPDQTAPVDGAEELPAPAVTEPQLGRIVERVVATVAEADATLDAGVAEQRLAGPALDVRKANYRILKRDDTQDLLPPLPAGAVRVVLPQQNDGWPRTVFTVVTGEEATVAPVALMLIQEGPRENYKVHYAMQMMAGVTLPQVAAAVIGAPRIPADAQLGLLAPGELAEAFGSFALHGEESEYAGLFNADAAKLRELIKDREATIRADLPRAGKISFTTRVGKEEPIAFGTNDTGLLVAVELLEMEKVTPNESGAAINPSDSIRALVGKAQTTKGIEAGYAVQLLFYVPPIGGGSDQIELLGYAHSLVSAREL